MNFLIPLLSAGAHAFGTAFEKLNLRRSGMPLRPLLVLEFAIMFFAIGVYILLVRPALPVISLFVAGLLAIIILLSFVQNILELKGIQAMEMHLREPISNLEPILTGVLAFLIFPSEGNIWYLAAIIAGVILVWWSSTQRFSVRHFFTLGSVYAFSAISLSAVLSLFIKFGLEFLSPPYLSFFRIGGVLLLSGLFFHASWKQALGRGGMLGISAGILFAAATITWYFSVQKLGLNFTLLVMMLEPGLIYLLSRFMLKERLEWKPVVASLGILGLIILVR